MNLKPCGFYLVDKAPDWTSFDVCARIKKHLNMKKVGHTGTLDPFATGLVVAAVGKATKLIPYINKAKKTYVADIYLGATTTTLDPESEVSETHTLTEIPTIEMIETIMKEQFTKTFAQVPPQFSAVKIKGKRAYAAARKGEHVEIPPRQVTVHSAKILEYVYPKLTVELTTAAGFYVRSFARDIAKAIGTLGYCTALRRTHVDDLSVTDAETIDTLTTPIDPKFIVDQIPHREITTGRLNDFWSGRAFPYDGDEGAKYLLIHQGKTIGVGEIIHAKLQPRVVL